VTARFVMAVALFALPAMAQGTIEFTGVDGEDARFLVAGEATSIEVTPSDARLRVVYRPGSRVEKHVDLEREDDGTFRFVPDEAGLVELRAIAQRAVAEVVLASKVVSVKFASAVSLGLLVMLLAGVILFGGAFLSIRALFRA